MREETINLVINAFIKVILDESQSVEIRCKAMDCLTKIIVNLVDQENNT